MKREASSNVNDKLDKFIAERGDYTFPHFLETYNALYKLAVKTGDADRAMVAKEIESLMLADPGCAFNFARFAKEVGRSLETGALPSLAEIIEGLGPHRIVANLASTSDVTQVFGDNPPALKLYQRVCAETSLNVKRVLDQVPPDQSAAAVFMVLHAALPYLGVASMAPEYARTILVAGEQVESVAEETLGFRLSELVPFLEERYGVPRSNNPAFSPKTRALARDAQQALRQFLKQPLIKAA